ncbi:MAG: twin-arginine translocase TatA/TatE family subunit [Ornithinibacter sp.]
MLGVNGWEVVLLALIAVFVLGPDRLPEYAAKLARGIRQLRVMAEGAKGQLKDQLGPEYEDINWRQYDPRQYDPRRIVKEALLDPLDEAVAPIRDEIGSVRSAASRDGAEAAGAEVAGGTAAVGVAAASMVASTDSEDSVPGAVRHVQQHSSDPRPPRDPRAWDPVRPIPFDRDAT